MLLNVNQIWNKNGQRTITFHILQTQVIKKNCCTLLLTKNWCFFKLVFLERKTLMLKQRTQLQIRKNTIRKRDLKDKTRQPPPPQKKKTKKKLMKKHFVISYFDVVLFMKQKQRNKAKKQRDKNKEAKKTNKNKEKEEGKKRTRERQRNREREREKKKGKLNKQLGRKKGRHWKVSKNAFFRGGENRFCSFSKQKKRKYN